MALPRFDVPCGVMSMRIGHQRAAHFFWRYWWGIAKRHLGEGLKLLGRVVEIGNGGFRQDRHVDSRPVCRHCGAS